MINIKKHIPNTITCGNLLCGCLAIVSAFKGDLIWSAYLVGIAAVLDFFDGFAARILNVHSEIGKQLDSLADMVTFGVVPGIVMFQLMQQAIVFQTTTSTGFQDVTAVTTTTFYLTYTAFLIPIFSAIRLAKFNVDTRQSSSFIGLTTTANAILICSFPLIINQLIVSENIFVEVQSLFLPIFNNYYFLIAFTILMSYLLVAELPLFALKFKNFTWADNKIRYSFLIISLLLLIVFQFIAIPFIIFLYILLSIINNSLNRKIPNV